MKQIGHLPGLGNLIWGCIEHVQSEGPDAVSAVGVAMGSSARGAVQCPSPTPTSSSTIPAPPRPIAPYTPAILRLVVGVWEEPRSLPAADSAPGPSALSGVSSLLMSFPPMSCRPIAGPLRSPLVGLRLKAAPGWRWRQLASAVGRSTLLSSRGGPFAERALYCDRCCTRQAALSRSEKREVRGKL